MQRWGFAWDRKTQNVAFSAGDARILAADLSAVSAVGVGAEPRDLCFPQRVETPVTAALKSMPVQLSDLI